MKDRSFLTIKDFSKEEVLSLIEQAKKLKEAKKKKKEKQNLIGKNIALIFEKASTRTRCAFEVASFDQGANVSYLDSSNLQLGSKESIKDTARVLGRFYDCIEYRGFGHSFVEELSKYAGVPVINGLTDTYHPTQALADILTIKEQQTKQSPKVVYIGNAKNNVSNSLILICAKLNIDLTIIAPEELFPEQEFLLDEITVTDNLEGIEHADFVYTDIWLSMGEDENLLKKRIELLKPYQVNKELMDKTDNAKFMHCLPCIHNRETTLGEKIYKTFGVDSLEVTEEVFESKNSIVFDQAENRMHTIKALLVSILGD